MKKLFSIACACAALAALADTEITCGNDVGMLEISSMATDTIVAVPFGELATGGDVCASNIVKTANLEKGDELYVYNPSGKSWTAWMLEQASGGYLYWKSVGTATIDAQGQISHGSSPQPNETYLVAGSAIWLKRKNPKVGDSAKPFYVYGCFVQSLQTSAVGGINNLVANPLSSPVDFEGVETGDQVSVVDSATKTTRYRWNDKKKKWAYTSSGGLWIEVDKLSVSAGQGLWYCPKHDRQIIWR